MNIHVCGINYKAAPLEVREKLSYNCDEQKEVIKKVHELKYVNECVLLSTCNRTEVYIYCSQDQFDSSCVEELICSTKGINVYDFKKYFYFYSGAKAVRHIYKVSCGLESLVLGEDQILGQVKSAHETAMKAGTTSVILNTLFREVITAAKKIKTCTDLSKKPISVASVAVKFISDQFKGVLDDKAALVIGSGEIGTIAMKNLVSKGIGQVYITSRSHSKASEVVKHYSKVQIVDYHKRYLFIDEADIVISCTSSPHYTITADMLEKSFSCNKKRVFVDLAVPRDIDVSIRDIVGVEYYNIDHLKSASDANTRKRLSEALKAEKMIEEFITDYERWYEFRNVLPMVKEIQEEVHRIANEKAERTISRLKSATEGDKEIVRQCIRNVVNCMMNRFVYRIKENGTKDDIRAYFKCLNEVSKEA